MKGLGITKDTARKFGIEVAKTVSASLGENDLEMHLISYQVDAVICVFVTKGDYQKDNILLAVNIFYSDKNLEVTIVDEKFSLSLHKIGDHDEINDKIVEVIQRLITQ